MKDRVAAYKDALAKHAPKSEAERQERASKRTNEHVEKEIQKITDSVGQMT